MDPAIGSRFSAAGLDYSDDFQNQDGDDHVDLPRLMSMLGCVPTAMPKVLDPIIY